ncbi:hypothetical protein CHS0354_042550 [Potamilus streckersoni]|uniref:Phytanoyl-CoA dioxygenase n=1 Tax=Potamilus streckersoni TaxID=2493646 RepID=A0AAE0WCR7_9BIVA|nr:hypothetical protein CHS0354_042550 [Potamilus streckersoni]
MITDTNLQELEEKGYTVVPNVVTPDDCDQCVAQYKEWLSQFKNGDWPLSSYSLIRNYNVGHMVPTWFIRLKSKTVFEQLWKTEKLLSSFDAIAIGRPPEDGVERFDEPGRSWLHLDQNHSRVGLHACQGAVYLEEACEDDWTLQVLESSHKYFTEFFEQNHKASLRSNLNALYRLRDNDFDFFEKKNCQVKRVPVTKGGMVLWDSRLVHANANPQRGRKHHGRWRYVVFVSMTPAHWAGPDDLETRKFAYENVKMTTHWSSNGVRFSSTAPTNNVLYPEMLPDIAKNTEAKQLSGVLPYSKTDGKPIGPMKPKWMHDVPKSPKNYSSKTGRLILVAIAIVLGITALVDKRDYKGIGVLVTKKDFDVDANDKDDSNHYNSHVDAATRAVTLSSYA